MLDGSTILVAEDEDPLQRLYVSWLDAAGANVLTAADGDEAIEKWTTDVDVVLLDRRMPESYGDEVLKTARGNGLHTPVAMVTAVTPDLDVIDMQFDDYLTKPTERDEFINTIENLLELGDIRNTVREFVRAGTTITALQNQHPHSLLDTHAGYQELRQQYRDMQTEIAENIEDLTPYEKQLLIRARDSL